MHITHLLFLLSAWKDLFLTGGYSQQTRTKNCFPAEDQQLNTRGYFKAISPIVVRCTRTSCLKKKTFKKSVLIKIEIWHVHKFDTLDLPLQHMNTLPCWHFFFYIFSLLYLSFSCIALHDPPESYPLCHLVHDFSCQYRKKYDRLIYSEI